MNPDFSKKTKETIAKRAGYICSNPDCRNKTVGPNSDPSRVTLIGEAAHIYGARENSKRYKKEMTDIARSELTNAIWLCRNCHKLIDSDDIMFSSKVLFKWRDIHEQHILSNLGTKTEIISFDSLNELIEKFEGFPPIVRRIIVDKPEYWEYRLTAEIMRYLNAPHFRRLNDLSEKLYIKKQEHVSWDDSIEWFNRRHSELLNILKPVGNILDKLTEAINNVRTDDDVLELLHLCNLISNYLEQVVLLEEEIQFSNFPEEFSRLHELYSNQVGRNATKLENVPTWLDSLVDKAINSDPEEQVSENNTIYFDLPENWAEDVTKEFKKLGIYYN